MENKLNLPLKKKKNEAESPRLDPLMRALKALHSAGATLTVALYVYAKEQGEFAVAFAIAAILMILTLIVNGAAALIGASFKRRRSL